MLALFTAHGMQRPTPFNIHVTMAFIWGRLLPGILGAEISTKMATSSIARGTFCSVHIFKNVACKCGCEETKRCDGAHLSEVCPLGRLTWEKQVQASREVC